MTTGWALPAAFVLILPLASGCPQALNAAGIPNYQQDRIDSAIEQGAFRYPDCPRAEIRLSRVSSDGRHIELSVCGTPRRYDDISPDLFSGPSAQPTWVDVTAATAR